MVTVAEIEVWGKFVGAVRWNQNLQLAEFEYDSAFLKNGWDLSPIHMPIQQEAQVYSFPALRAGRENGSITFKGMPGLLADVLPDRYGNQLIQQWLTANGRGGEAMNPVEQLCFIGSRGMGALEFRPSRGEMNTNGFSVELESLIETARNLEKQRAGLRGNFKENEQGALRQLVKIGTSAGGARPKAVIAFNPKTGEMRSGQTNAPAGFEHWLIKLDGVSDAQFGSSHGFGNVEYAYYLMAKACGIEMSECRLFEENNRAHFMTKRFDRTASQEKIHVQTWCGINHMDYNEMFAYSYEQLFQTMRALRLTYAEAEEQFRRMVFNVLAVNYDDHTKNFSFLLPKNDRWKLAPAYDLCFSFDPTNHWVSQQTLSVNGKRNSITYTDLLIIAKRINIKKPKEIIDQVLENVGNWLFFATEAKVNLQLKDQIDAKIKQVHSDFINTRSE